MFVGDDGGQTTLSAGGEKIAPSGLSAGADALFLRAEQASALVFPTVRAIVNTCSQGSSPPTCVLLAVCTLCERRRVTCHRS